MFRLRDKSITLRKPQKFSDSFKRTDTKKEVLCLNPPTDMTEIVLHNPGACCSRTASQQRVKPFKRRGGTAGGSGAGTVSATPRRASRAPIKPIQRNAANARERSRMRVLSKAFGRLKTSLPWVPPDTKLSKLDTLRLASSYISHLKKLLEDDTLDGTLVHPLNLTWPFAISSRPITTDDTSDDKETRSDTTMSDVMSESP